MLSFIRPAKRFSEMRRFTSEQNVRDFHVSRTCQHLLLPGSYVSAALVNVCLIVILIIS